MAQRLTVLSQPPPRFDFSKSDNVEAVTVLWPAPKKFDDGAGGTSIVGHGGDRDTLDVANQTVHEFRGIDVRAIAHGVRFDARPLLTERIFEA